MGPDPAQQCTRVIAHLPDSGCSALSRAGAHRSRNRVLWNTTDVNQSEGFLPIVWEVPGTDMEAADAVAVVTKYLRTLFEFRPDAAESLTVLHNRTNMVRVFGNSVTVKNSEGETRTRCVTSCAGSTSYMSVVAQTRRGFLSGGSASQTKNMTDQEKEIQLEEAYARATVALTRARRLCVLLCPLDQKGPIGAATILGCLQYGLGHLHFSDLANASLV